jgi:hypothetical protein
MKADFDWIAPSTSEIIGFHFSSQIPDILIVIISGYLQFLQENAGILS